MDSPLITALLHPDAYPHPVESVALIETHISWVLLTGEYAYKIKKPVDFGFLDFSTLAKRQRCCEEELRLNRRFAPEIYLAVVAITGTPEQPHIGAEDSATRPVIEWAVRMWQFDPSATLDVLASHGQLQTQDFQTIGRQLADFHYRIALDAPTHTDITPPPGSPDSVWAAVQQNFDQIRPFLNEPETQLSLTRIEAWSAERFEQLEPLIRSRRATGFVRDCHGDLHLQNMALLGKRTRAKREIIFFDCIDFNPSLRLIDVASELAFVLMDLQARNMPRAANTLLNTYLEYSGDFASLALLTFYQCYRAMVRAKVALLQVEDATQLTSHPNYTLFLNYLQLGSGYTATAKPFIAITHGVSGTGKSTAAASIAEASGAVRLRSDVERKRIYGLAPQEASDKSIYSAEASNKTFQRLQELVQEVIGAGFPCIVDATFLHRGLREDFHQQARQLQVPFHILSCQAPEAVMIERLHRRTQTGDDASEATETIMLDQLQQQQPLTEAERTITMHLDTTAALALPDIVDTLRKH